MDNRVTELQCIMPIGNIPSVLARGILSHETAAKLEHRSVAMPAMQDRRDVKTVPGGLRLHQYANLYFHARNPMLSVRRHEDVCVLRVSTAVLEIQGTVITDQNAASNYVRFYAPAQSNLLDFNDIYARDWRHPDNQIREWQHKSSKCVEVLVPQRVQANLLIGAYAVDDAARSRLNQMGFTLPVSIDADLFFR
jgi:ssDNA thymidine ADP-ribosyltransferase, DarT